MCVRSLCKLIPGATAESANPLLVSCSLSPHRGDHPPGLVVTCGQQVVPPAILIFLARNSCYKSKATQILQNVGLAPVRTAVFSLVMFIFIYL